MRSSMIVFRAVADKFPDKNVKYLEPSDNIENYNVETFYYKDADDSFRIYYTELEDTVYICDYDVLLFDR